MTAVAHITGLFGGLFDRRGLQVIHLMAGRADSGMTGEAIVCEQLAMLDPAAGNTHDLVVEAPMAHQAHVRIDVLALDQVGLTGRR